MLKGAPKLIRGLSSLSAGSSFKPREPSAKPLTRPVELEDPKNPAPSDSSIRGGRRTSRRDTAPAAARFRPDPVALVPRSSPHPDAESICCLLSHQSNRSRPVGDLLGQHRGKLTSELVFRVLCDYRNLGRARTLEFFSWAGLDLSFQFDDAVVEYMADFLGRRKLFDDLKCLLRTVSSSKGSVSARAVSICIRFLGRQGRVADALSLFEAMESELNCPPDNLVFNNVLYVLCKMSLTGDSVDVALGIFRRIRCPDEYSYSNMLSGLCKTGRTDLALKVFYEMSDSNLAPTRSAANVLIGELCELGAKSEAVEKVPVRSVRRPFDILVPNVGARAGMKPALEVFWAVWKLGLLPSAFVLNRLISELCHLGKIEEAVDVLKVVGAKRPRSFEESYTAMIKALCRVRRTDNACELFERMVSVGLKPKVAVYSSIISALCKLGNLEGAEKYFEIMSKMRCEPDSVTYTVLIHAYCRIQNWEAAYELLIEMIGLGLCPHFGTYCLVDSFLKGRGRIDLSVKLEAKMEAQTLHQHCKTGKLEAALETINTMIEKGIYPPIYIIDSLKHTFRGSSKWKMIKELLNKMDQVSFRNISET